MIECMQDRRHAVKKTGNYFLTCSPWGHGYYLAWSCPVCDFELWDRF